MVGRIARDVRRMFARHIDIRDLTQAGNVGLMKAANSYYPSKGNGSFEPFAYFRVRGAIIDSQKRRTYREESHLSIQAIAAAHDGWLPPELDTDRKIPADELASQNQLKERLRAAIAALPEPGRSIMACHMEGLSLTVTAHRVGLSLTWTREKLAEARAAVTVTVKGK